MTNPSSRRNPWEPRSGSGMGGTTGRPSWRSSFLGDPDAKFFGEKRGRSKNREKRTKAWWKRTPLLEIRKERGFLPRLEKASPTTLGFFTVPTGPTAVINSKLFQAAIHLKSG